MSAWMGRRRLGLATEVALAFGAGAASFALVAVTLAVAGSVLVGVALAVTCVAAVVAVARLGGVAYAVPIAIAAVLAFDWFTFPPTHPHTFPDAANLADLLAFLASAVLVGEAAAHAGRRADVSEEARAELADEQAALRRVATLVARGVPPAEVFAAVSREAGLLLGVDGARVVRYDGEDHVEQLAGWGAPGRSPLPQGRRPHTPASVTGEVRRTGRVIRIDDYARPAGEEPTAPAPGVRSVVGAPIVVDGRLWGAVLAWLMRPVALPDTAEARLGAFTELVATALSNSASRGALGRLAEEQAALRRVATLVARGVPPPEVFGAVAREVGLLLGVEATHMGRYDSGGAAIALASWKRAGEAVPVGTRFPIDGGTVAALVLRTGRPARMDAYEDASGPVAETVRELGLRSSVGAPIVVDGRLWGVMIASATGDEPLPADTEERIAAFTELVATAISNTEARAQSELLADEQAALRRVATMVARESPPAEIFAAVAEQLAGLLGVDDMRMIRFDRDGEASAVVVGGTGVFETTMAVGTRSHLDGRNLDSLVLQTGRPARIDDSGNAAGPLAAFARAAGVRSAVAGPIVVNGRVWGAMIASSQQATPLPADIEARIGKVTDLIATAVSNVQARSDLAASRARILEATDDERRRVVRDLHDGAQQRLVHTVIRLKLARRALEADKPDAAALVTQALHEAERATEEVRELAHGILPSVLTRGGLRAGVEALASRSPVPVDIAVSVGRLAPAVEATAYFVVAEALTNVAKHAGARRAEVAARVDGGTLRVDVCDDGVGGARADGTGLVGLVDRLAVLDGRLRVEDRAGGGTLLRAHIPVSG